MNALKSLSCVLLLIGPAAPGAHAFVRAAVAPVVLPEAAVYAPSQNVELTPAVRLDAPLETPVVLLLEAPAKPLFGAETVARIVEPVQPPATFDAAPPRRTDDLPPGISGLDDDEDGSGVFARLPRPKPTPSLSAALSIPAGASRDSGSGGFGRSARASRRAFDNARDEEAAFAGAW